MRRAPFGVHTMVLRPGTQAGSSEAPEAIGAEPGKDADSDRKDRMSSGKLLSLSNRRLLPVVLSAKPVHFGQDLLPLPH
jgi:ribosome biogenesis protein Tsr3